MWEVARLIVEVDGIHHMDAAQYWADMDRNNDFILDGYRVLRFPAFIVRYNPGYVAGKIRDALQGAGSDRTQTGCQTGTSPGDGPGQREVMAWRSGVSSAP